MCTCGNSSCHTSAPTPPRLTRTHAAPADPLQRLRQARLCALPFCVPLVPPLPLLQHAPGVRGQHVAAACCAHGWCGVAPTRLHAIQGLKPARPRGSVDEPQSSCACVWVGHTADRGCASSICLVAACTLMTPCTRGVLSGRFCSFWIADHARHGYVCVLWCLFCGWLLLMQSALGACLHRGGGHEHTMVLDLLFSSRCRASLLPVKCCPC